MTSLIQMDPSTKKMQMSSNLTPRQRTGVLITMCVALIAVVSSVSGLNVALNDLAVDLGASTSALLWVVNAYTLAMAALLLPLGEIGDRWGRARMLSLGLIVFGVANALSVTAGDATTLIVYRTIAGVGAAMIMPATLSTLTSVFPAEERGRAVGIWAGFAGAGGILGLFSSAVLIDYASWQWLFVLPIVASIASLIATRAIVPDTRNEEVGSIDLRGAVLSAIGVGGIVLGIHEGPELGWTAPLVLASLIGGAASLIAFVRWQLRANHPLLDVRIFSHKGLAAGAFSLTLMFALMFGVFLVVIQYLQAVLGLSAVASAAGLLPMAVAMMGLSPVAPQFAQRIGLRTVLVAGSVLLAGGFAWMALFADQGTYLWVLPGLVIIGLGVGLSMSPATTAITEALPEEKQGVASALNDTVREFGASVGVALIGSGLSAGYASSIADTAEALPPELAEPVEEGIGQAMAVAAQLGPDGQQLAVAAQNAFLDGWDIAMIVAAATALGAGLVTAAIFGRRPTEVSSTPEQQILAA